MSIVSKKRHLACFLSFFFAVSSLFAQDAAAAPNGSTAGSGAAPDETSLVFGAQPDGAQANAGGKGSSPSSVLILVRIVVVLALVCAGIYGVVYLLKKSSGGSAGNDPYLKAVASLYFSPSKSVQVVTLGDRAYMVGVTDQAINLLAEVGDRELVDAMNLNADKKNPVPPGTFRNLMANFFPGSKGSPGPIDGARRDASASGSGASFGGAEFIRSQRERLRNAGGTPGPEDGTGGGEA